MTTRNPTCRHCGKALSALRQRLADSCEAAACRHKAVLVPLLQRRAQLLQAQRVHAAERSQEPRLLEAPMVWLREHDTEMVAVTAEDRAGQAAWLAAIAAAPHEHPREPHLADWPQDGAPAPAVDGPVCGCCRGRCCRAGLPRHGFIDVGVLSARQERQGGTLADAAAHYVSRLPAEHLDGSCLYHGVRGCALPREERAPICNGFACTALKDARRHIADAPATGALVATEAGVEVSAAVWLHVVGGRPRTRKLPPLPRARRRLRRGP